MTGSPSTVQHVYADGPVTHRIRATATDGDGTYTVGDPGTLNAAFGDDGLAKANFANGVDYGYAIARQNDGKILVAESGDDKVFRVLRYNTDGTLDTRFGNGGIVTTAVGARSEARAIAIQPDDGKIVVAGYVYNAESAYDYHDFAVVRYNSDGTLDRTFSDDGMLTTDFERSNDQANAVVIQSGKIVVVGTAFSPINNSYSYNFAVARYLSDGTLDTTFSGDGKATFDLAGDSDYARAVAIQGSNILVAGSAYNGNYTDFGLIRVQDNGNLDSTFNNNTGKSLTDFSNNYDYANAITVSGTEIVLSGAAYMGANSYDFAIARYGENGQPINSFVVPSAGDDYAYAVAVRPDSKIVAGGYGRFGSSTTDMAVVQLTTAGALDTTALGGDGKATVDVGGTTDYGYAMLLDQDGKIVLAGGANNGTTSYDLALARIGLDGNPDTSFNSTGKLTASFAGTYDHARAVMVQSDGKVLVAGEKSYGSARDWGAAGNSSFGVARFSADGILDTTFGTNGWATAFAGNSYAYAIAPVPGPDGKFVVAGYGAGSYSPDFAVARFSSNGTLDTTFSDDGMVTYSYGARTLDYAYAVAVQDDGKVIVAGAVYDTQAPGRSYDLLVMRYNANGILDTTFGEQGSGKVRHSIGLNADYNYSIALQDDGKIVLAGTSLQGAKSYDMVVVRLRADGTLDDRSGGGQGFGTNGGGFTTVDFGWVDYAYGVDLDSQNRIVVAGCAKVGTQYDLALARFTADGLLDSSFNGTGKLTYDIAGGSDYAYALKIEPDDKIVVAGRALNGTDADILVMRYTTAGQLDSSFGNGGITLTDHVGGYDFGQAMDFTPQGELVVAGPVWGPAGYDFGVAHYFGESGGLKVDVTDVAPTLTVRGADSVGTGQTYTLTLGPVVDPGQDTVTSYSIHWGDGTTTTKTAAELDAAGRRVEHVYLTASQPSITVDVTNEDGVYTVATKAVAVLGVLYWDSDGISANGFGGSGQWTSANCWFDPTTSTYTTWTAGNNKVAVFKDAVGSVTLPSAVDAAGIVFQTSGYTLSGGTITLTGAGGSISSTAVVSATIDSPIEGAVGLTKTGTGTLILKCDNTYGGGTTIDAGTLQVGNNTTTGTLGSGAVQDNASLVFYRSGTATIDNAISGSGTVKHQGSGNTLILTGNNTYLGGTTITSYSSVSPTTLEIGEGGTLGSGGVTAGSYYSGSYFGTLKFNQSSVIPVTSAISGKIDVIQQGSGAVMLTGNNTYTGTTTINAGTTLQVGSSNPTGTGTVFVNGTLELHGSPTVSGLSGSGIVTSGVAGVSTLTAGAGNQSSTFAGEIQNGAGTVALTKAGTGTLTLTGNNTYSGVTTIDVGTLQVGNNTTTGTLGSGAVQDNASLVFYRSGTATIDNAISGSGTVKQQGSANTLILRGGNSYSGGTTITSFLSNSPTTLEIGEGGALGSGGVTAGSYYSGSYFAALKFNRSDALAVSSAISGKIDMIQQGSGAVTLTGNNTYTGTTTINAGTLQVGAGGTTGSLGSGAINNAGSLVFNRSDTAWLSTPLSGNGGLRQEGSGTLRLDGTYLLNAATVTNGTLQVDGSLTVTGQWANTGTLRVVGDGVFSQGTTRIAGDAAAISAGEVFLSSSGMGSGSGAFSFDISTDGVSYYPIASGGATDSQTLLSGLQPNTAYHLRSRAVLPGGGQQIYDGGMVTTWAGPGPGVADTSGWYRVSSITCDIDSTFLTATAGSTAYMTPSVLPPDTQATLGAVDPQVNVFGWSGATPPGSAGIFNFDRSWFSADSFQGAVLQSVVGLVSDQSAPVLTADGEVKVYHAWATEGTQTLYDLWTFDAGRYPAGGYSAVYHLVSYTMHVERVDPEPPCIIPPKCKAAEPGGGCGLPAASGGASLPVPAITGNGPAPACSATRGGLTYSSREYTFDTGFGPGWSDADELPLLVGGSQNVVARFGAEQTIWFDAEQDGSYIARYGAKDTLVHDTAERPLRPHRSGRHSLRVLRLRPDGSSPGRPVPLGASPAVPRSR